MSSRPVVSIVIPTRDRRAVLERCLAALARQTYEAFEVIVVDDGSADDTQAMLERFAGEYRDVTLRVLCNGMHCGANPSRNRGIRESCGEFVAFIDSDCLARPDWLHHLMGGFTSKRVAAVTGRVEDVPARNIYELVLKGNCRLHRPGPAQRLVAGNMCVRRSLLLKYQLDEDRAERDARLDARVSGRGDEEGLFLLLRAAGHDVVVVPEAVVVHDHPFTRNSFFRQALRGGRSAARLAYKYYLPPRLDMLPFLLTYLTLPLVLLHWVLAAVPLLFIVGALAALTYNELARKGKTVRETLRSFPMLLIYYHVRLGGYVFETLRLRITGSGPRRVRLDRVEKEFHGRGGRCDE